MTVREEMEKVLSGTSLPVEKKQEVMTRVTAVVERYASLYPHPDVLRQIEELAPGSTKIIIDTAVETIKHNNDIEARQVDLDAKELDLIASIAKEDFKSVRQGRWFGLFAFTFLFGFAGVMHHLGAEYLSYAAFGVGSLGIVAQLIAGGPNLPSRTSLRSGEGESSAKGKDKLSAKPKS